MQPKMIYLDNASTTSVYPEVLKTYSKLLEEKFVNSESLYDAGVELASILENSRASIARLMHVKKEEVIFTSGASEANSMIIKGIAFANMNSRKHLITTEIEHSSVANAMKQLEDYFGFEVTRLPVDQDGVISLDDLKKALRPDTLLVSIMMVNNEVGSIMPIKEISEIVKKNAGTYLHMDGVQALGKIDIDLSKIDCATFSAHKIHGLKGSGLCIKKQHVPLLPLINGGQQEFHLRGGTENALVNIMFAKTLRLTLENQKKSVEHCAKLKQLMIQELTKIDGIEINSPQEGVCSIVNFSCRQITSEVMMNALNQRGFCVSAQSTCSSKSKAASHVLLAMGKSEKMAISSIRCSFSMENTEDEVLAFVQACKECIEKYGTEN